MKKKDGGCEEILYPLILYQNNPTDEQECEYMTGETYSLPMVALRGLTILPEEVRHFDVSRKNHRCNRRGSKKRTEIIRQRSERSGNRGAGRRRCISGWLCGNHKTGGKITEENESCTCIRRSKSKSCKTGQ